ncbi:MTG1, partial [Symbiodinium sp. KB8]
VPLSSTTPVVREVIGDRQHVVVFNKADLAAPRMQAVIRERLSREGQETMFVSSHSQRSVRRFVEHLVEVAGAGHRPAGSVFLVLGVPNAGKSSLIKAVAQAGQGSKRRGKRRRGPVTGRKAGVTRFTSAFPVSTDPAVFLMDSPGILVPRIQDTTQGVKLALCGALPDASVPADELAHFLLCHARDTRSKAFR